MLVLTCFYNYDAFKVIKIKSNANIAQHAKVGGDIITSAALRESGAAVGVIRVESSEARFLNSEELSLIKSFPLPTQLPRPGRS